MRTVSRLRLLYFLLFTSLLMCCPFCYLLPCRNLVTPIKNAPRDLNPISRIVPYNQSDWQCALICSASPGGNYRASRYDAIVPITHSFHPLPDRDRSRIASGLWVRRLPPVVVTLLLIVRVTLSRDTWNVLINTV